MTTNIVTAKFYNSRRTTTRPLTQYNYGQILRIEGINLPDSYEVDFSNSQYNGDSKTQIGNASGVQIPEEYINSGKDIYAFIYLHTGEDDGETVYWIKIPNELRPARTEETPTPEEQSIIDQTIAALNTGVQKVENIADNLEDQIDTALQEAKDSGYFDGEDGFSPEISVENITGGHRVTIVDKDDTQTLDVMDGDKGNGIQSVRLNNDYTLTLNFTDGTTYTTLSIRGSTGATPQLGIGTVKEGASAAASITGTAEHPVLNLTLPNADVPTKVSELENDSNYAVDANYVHTDNNYTTAEKTKLNNIAAGAEVNVNADWNANSGDARILNKPTNVSAFNNDSGYLTEHQDISGKADKSEIPTKVSQLQNDSGYISSFTETDPTVPSWAKAANKPSYTAAEVGAATEQEVVGMIAVAISQINSFDMAVVQALPAQNISTHTIYLVPKTGEINDVYDEYVYINNNWEKIGNTQIDLSGYALKSELPTKVSDLTNDAGYLTSHQDISGKANIADLAEVATSGDYDDLINKPTIPTVPVQSVNGKIGAVVLDATDVGAGTYSKPSGGIPASDLATAVQMSLGKADTALQSAPVQSVNGQTGAVVLDAQDIGAYEKPVTGIPKTDLESAVQVSLGKADTALQSAPVTSVNSKTGEVVLTPSDVGAGTYSKPAGGIPASDLAAGVIPEVPVQDVQVNGTSVLGQDGVANVPMASANAPGVVISGSVNVTGTTPTITALPGIRYVCGDVATLSFTPSATGICDVVFTSGSTATVLTVPNTVKWPTWFDPTSLQANVNYEINIMDGVYGVVGIWI